MPNNVAASSVPINPWRQCALLPLYPVTISRLWREGSTNPPRGFALPYFARIVCQKYALRIDDLKGRSRKQKLSWARQEFMALAHASGKLSMPQIGQFLGRDHTTVLWGIRAHKRRVGVSSQRQLARDASALPAPEERSRPSAETHTDLA